MNGAAWIGPPLVNSLLMEPIFYLGHLPGERLHLGHPPGERRWLCCVHRYGTAPWVPIHVRLMAFYAFRLFDLQ